MSNLQSTDFLIVGQGLVGTVLAHKLLQLGKSVIVIDNSHHHSASLVAAGLYNPFIFKYVTKSWNADELLPEMRRTYREIQSAINTEILHETGLIRFVGSDHEQKAWKKKSVRPNFSIHLGSVPPNHSYLEKSRGFGAVSISTAGWLNTAVMIEAFAQHLQKNNLLTLEKFDHSALQVGEKCTYKNIVCNQVVFCEGTGVKNNPFFSFLPFNNTKGEVLDIRASDVDIEQPLNYGQFIVPSEPGKYRTGTTYSWSTLDHEPSAKARQIMLEKHHGFFGSTPEVLEQRAGIRPTAPDRRPYAGRHPQHRSLSILNATGSKGVMLAPWCAEQLINHLLHNATLHPELDISRVS